MMNQFSGSYDIVLPQPTSFEVGNSILISASSKLSGLGKMMSLGTQKAIQSIEGTQMILPPDRK